MCQEAWEKLTVDGMLKWENGDITEEDLRKRLAEANINEE